MSAPSYCRFPRLAGESVLKLVDCFRIGKCGAVALCMHRISIHNLRDRDGVDDHIDHVFDWDKLAKRGPNHAISLSHSWSIFFKVFAKTRQCLRQKIVKDSRCITQNAHWPLFRLFRPHAMCAYIISLSRFVNSAAQLSGSVNRYQRSEKEAASLVSVSVIVEINRGAVFQRLFSIHPW